jgi:Na+-transporting NADH:ubiquinone oxidoreductase subunit C
MAEDTARHNFVVTAVLALICSLLVSLTAIGLGARQDRNRELDRKTKILQVTGLYDPTVPVEESFDAAIETRLIDLESGEYVAEDVAPEGYDQRLALSSPELSRPLPTDQDVAGIGRKEKYSYVYLVSDDDGLDQIVLPVRGRGLYSTLYAYLSLDADLHTVRGITFYEHGETAGLGGEVENPKWTALWPGKQIYDDSGSVELSVVKGTVDPAAQNARFAVDGLSGATFTSKGVTNLVHYWFGDTGFGPYLDRLAEGGATSG